MKFYPILILAALMLSASCKPNTPDQTLPSDSVSDSIVESPDAFAVNIEDLVSGPFVWNAPMPKGGTINHAGLSLSVKLSSETQMAEGDEYTIPVAEVSLDNELLMRLEGSEDGTIYDISILSPKVAAPKDLHVGSTLEEFLAQEPKTNIYYTYISNMLWLELPQYQNYQFLVAADDCKPSAISTINGDLTVLSPSDLKPQSKVIAIRALKSN